jgi:hypothetical protein
MLERAVRRKKRLLLHNVGLAPTASCYRSDAFKRDAALHLPLSVPSISRP